MTRPRRISASRSESSTESPKTGACCMNNEKIQESKFELEFELLTAKLKKELDKVEARTLPEVCCCPGKGVASCCPCGTSEGREYLAEVCDVHAKGSRPRTKDRSRRSHRSSRSSHRRSRSQNRRVTFK